MKKPDTMPIVSDEFWEDVIGNIHQLPELPKATYKINGWTIEAVDLRIIRGEAVALIGACIKQATLDRDIKTLSFDASIFYDDIDELGFIVELVMAASRYKARKRKVGDIDGCFLIDSFGYQKNTEDKTMTLEVDLLQDDVEFIFDYAKKHSEKPIDYYEMLACKVGKKYACWQEFLSKGAEADA